MAKIKRGRTRTIGLISDEILAKRLEEKDLKAQLEVVEKSRKLLETELQTAAEEAGLSSGGGKQSKFTIAEITVPQVKDWDEFYKFIKDNDFFHLLNRRPTVVACQELWAQSKDIPGVEKFTSNKVTVKGT